MNQGYLFEFYPNFQCNNCKHSFNTGEFSQKLKTKYRFVHENTRWGPSFCQCPNCEHHNYFQQKPFYKMRWYEKGWTLMVMLFVALFYGLFSAIAIGSVLFAMTYFYLPSNFKIQYSEIVIGLLVFGIPVVFDYFYKFLHDERFLE